MFRSSMEDGEVEVKGESIYRTPSIAGASYLSHLALVTKPGTDFQWGSCCLSRAARAADLKRVVPLSPVALLKGSFPSLG